jgi:nucleoside-triphosphatase THEP1
MIRMVVGWLLIVVGVMLIVVPNVGDMKLFSRFFHKSYDNILKDFNKVLHKLENFAAREEAKAEQFLNDHIELKKLEQEARTVAAKARSSASKIGSLIA